MRPPIDRIRDIALANLDSAHMACALREILVLCEAWLLAEATPEGQCYLQELWAREAHEKGMS
jgi:hypothetical protein